MQYIILDVECNSSRWDSNHMEEIIDIAAYKVSSEDLKIIDSFQSLVKPVNKLTKFSTKLTGLTENDLLSAPSFQTVYKDLINFLGEDYCFVSWGKEDYRFLAINCEFHQLDKIDCSNQIDVQAILLYGMSDVFQNPPGLKSALETLELQWEGEAHRALTDSFNTLKVFRYVFDKFDAHATYKSNKTAEERFVFQKRLNSKGKKNLNKWVFSYMKSSHDVNVSFHTFFSSQIWKEKVDEHDLNETVIQVFQKGFEKEKKKAQEKYSRQYV